ncbi:hypothetical protein BH09VER1_BH09VER1_30980 [soil metagenome]
MQTLSPPRSLSSFLVAFAALVMATGLLQAGDAAAPLVLFDPAAPGGVELAVAQGGESDVQAAVANGGIDVKIVANGKTGFPGFTITPTQPWDASKYGHVEAKVTNNGTKPVRISVRADNAGPWQENRYSATVLTVKPGQTLVVPAIFGYQFNAPAYPLDPSKIVRVGIFSVKSDVEQNFHVEAFQAAGAPGEKPYVDPNTIAVKPAGGVMLGGMATFDATKQVAPRNGAKGVLAADGKGVQVDFAGGRDEYVMVKPVAGLWNLNEHLEVRVKFKNTGSTPVTPGVRLESKGGPSDVVLAKAPLAPGAEGEVVVPFMAAVRWKGPVAPEQEQLEFKKDWIGESEAGTGTKYTSNSTTSVAIVSDKSAGAKSLLVESIVADLPPAPPLPAWLGQRPPAEGDWVKTLDENFDGDSINLKLWNIYTYSAWHHGEKGHYSKDNVIVKNGMLALHAEKKFGHHNDDPSMPANNYATGYADTIGKWTQRYGYFEARMKLVRAPSLSPAVWLMPDRGVGDFNARANTKEGGMEFDIMETLSIWGVNRHDFGVHWDGYMKYHKSLGFMTAYTHPDKDGFITVGMLWTPGVVVEYDNGVETGRWESPRISTIQSYLILYNIFAGWETEPIDDKQLPADFLIDYVRVWQRKDLASPGDGPKPNNGDPHPPEAPAAQ